MVRRKGKKNTAEESALDIDNLIAMAVSTGKVKLGGRIGTKESKTGKVKAFILADNCPQEQKMEIEYNAKFSNIPIIYFPKSSFELGAAIGRPHKVAVITVYDPGNSKLLEVTKSSESSD
ncbi:MAG: 50S ribosomal protein L30e [Candidatus Thorarchaeota archaeon]